jgi:hypothetical protein
MIHAFTDTLRPTRLRAALVALLAVVAGASCDNSDSSDPAALAPSSETPVVAEGTDVASGVTPAFATSYSGVPYGPSGLAGSGSLSMGPSFLTGRQVHIDASGIVTLINQARDRGQRLVLAMTGGSAKDYTTNGKFDITKWKKKMSTYNTATIRNAIASAVSSGVVVGNTMIDEPETVKWGGNVTKATIDAMAVYARNIFPSLPMGINIGPPAYKWRSSERFTKLDWVRYQYSWWVTEGNVSAWRTAVLAQAVKDGVTPAFSLNVLDGGVKDKSGSWDCPGSGKGTYAPNCRMVPDQVRAYGKALGTSGCFLMMWRYDDAYMSKTANQDAFRDVASTTNSAPRRSCKG